MDARSIGTIVMIVGLGALLVGGLILTGALSWFGRLPGDIRIENEGSRIYIPITSMLLISAALTLIVSLFRRL
ncbi:MAG: DUF2905 domain-containing protein [Actinomycetota bacterium]